VCTVPAQCLTGQQAAEIFGPGNYTQTSPDSCGQLTGAAGFGTPQYCYERSPVSRSYVNTCNRAGEGSAHPDHADIFWLRSYCTIWNDTTDNGYYNRSHHVSHNLTWPAGVYNTSFDHRTGKTHNRTNTIPCYDWIPAGFGIFRNSKTAHHYRRIPQIRSPPGCQFTVLSIAGNRSGNDADYLSGGRQVR
jgi:hypothetical protein